MVKKKKMKLGTKIAIGLGVVAAGVGVALLHWLSTQAKAEPEPDVIEDSWVKPVAGVPIEMMYIPGVLYQSVFYMPRGTISYTTKSLLEEINEQAGERVVSSVGVWRDGRWITRTTWGGPEVILYPRDIVMVSVSKSGVVWIPTPV